MRGESADAPRSLVDALSPLRDTDMPAALARAVDDMLADADQRELPRRIEDLERSLQQLIVAVTSVRDRLDSLAGERTRTPFGEAWWEYRRRAVDSPGALADWIAACAEAVLAGRYDVALRLAAEDEGLVPQDMAPDALAGVHALEDGDLAGAVGILRTILDGPWDVPREAGARLDLEILLARGLLQRAGDVAAARDRLQAAADGTAHLDDARLRSRVRSALGECLLFEGDDEAARAAFAEALDLEEDEPSALIGMGLLAERQEDWRRAEEFYDRAVRTVEDPGALGRLHAFPTGNVYWRMSRWLSTRAGGSNGALRALDHALQLGMTGGEPFPERRAYVDKGYLLERLGRTEEAARCFAEGAQRYTWSGRPETSRALLERAVDLDPKDARSRWSLMDALRQLAQRPDGSADPALIRAALRHWEAGLTTRRPSRDEAWVYVAYALTAYDDVRGDRSEWKRLWNAAAAAERAVLLDDTFAGALVQLSSFYGDLGKLHAAFDASDRALAVDPSDDTAAFYRSRALLGLGRVAEARESLPPGKDAWLRAQAAFLHLVRDQAHEALAALDLPGEPGTGERLLRAFCLISEGHDDAAGMELGPEPGEAELVTRSDLHEAAWISYVHQNYDRAVALLERALDADPAEPADELLDYGQALLARGHTRDLSIGEGHLSKGVRDCSRWDTLRLIDTIELPFLLRRVAEKEHGAAVASVVGRVRPLIAERMDGFARVRGDARTEMQAVLDAAPDDHAPAAVAARASLARVALTTDPETALEHYLVLTADVAEAWEGVVRAATRIRDRLDGTAYAGAHDPGREGGYHRLLRTVRNVPGHATASAEAQFLRRGLAVRAAVAAVLSGHRHDAEEILAGESPAEGGPDREITDAINALIRDGDDYWRLTDGLAEFRDDSSRPASLRSWAEVLLEAASLDAVHRTRRDDVDMAAIYPLESPVVVSLGPGLVADDPGQDWVLVRELVPHMRERIRDRMGITVPGIRFRGDEQEAAGYRICWDGQEVRTGTATCLPESGDDEHGLTEVIADLEQVLVENLDRLFGPDDVDLWKGEIDPDVQSQRRPAAAWLLGSPESRLQTHRVLRMLIREGFPLVDGMRVLDAVAEAMAEGSGDPLMTVAHVRGVLRERVPGVDSDRRQLPDELERLVAAELQDSDSGTVWLGPWEKASEVVRAVRTWQDSEVGGGPESRAALVVSDPRVRHCLWRLLAPGGRRAIVITDQEAAAPHPFTTTTRSGEQ